MAKVEKRRRSIKEPGSTRHYTGNLIAFGPARNAVREAPRVARPINQRLKTNVTSAVQSYDAGPDDKRPVDGPVRAPVNGSSNASARFRAKEHGNTASSSRSVWSTRNTTTAAAIVVLVATGAVAYSIWQAGDGAEQSHDNLPNVLEDTASSNVDAPSQEPAVSPGPLSSGDVDAPSQEPAVSPGPLSSGDVDAPSQETAVSPSPISSGDPSDSTYTAASAAVAGSSPTAAQVQAAAASAVEQQRLADQYRGEINKLQNENASLKAAVESITTETTELNQSLLELELAISARQSESEPEVRTVFNFVNVSGGVGLDQIRSRTEIAVNPDGPGDDFVESFSNDPGDNFSDDRDGGARQVDGDVVPLESSPTPVSDVDAELKLRWDNDGEPIEFIDAYPEDEVADDDQDTGQ